MGKMKKIKKKLKAILVLLLISVSTVVVSNLILIMTIELTKEKVIQVCFTKKYFVKSDDYYTKIDNFKKFMLDSNWMFIEIYNEKMIFRKENLQKEINIDSLIEI